MLGVVVKSPKARSEEFRLEARAGVGNHSPADSSGSRDSATVAVFVNGPSKDADRSEKADRHGQVTYRIAMLS
jgi:ribonuclease PH